MLKQTYVVDEKRMRIAFKKTFSAVSSTNIQFVGYQSEKTEFLAQVNFIDDRNKLVHVSACHAIGRQCDINCLIMIKHPASVYLELVFSFFMSVALKK